MEDNPDYWFRFNAPDSLFGAAQAVREQLARYIGAASGKDVVFVDNATGGMNAVLRSIRLPPTASILFLNVVYGAVRTTIQYVSQHDGQEAMEQVDVAVPSSSDAIVAAVKARLEANPQIKLASFSHITSIPAQILPVKRLAAACHEHGVLVVIDGAHALGQIPINVADIGADFYVANGHKWLYSPKGSAGIVL
mgnify:CR=1 FL=1